MVCLVAGVALLVTSGVDEARQKVDQAIRLLGGRERLASIRQLTTTTTGHGYLVEQSERPTGPYVTVYTRGTRTYDFDTFTETSEQTFAGLVYGPKEFKHSFKIENGAGRVSPVEAITSYFRIALGPERALLLAADARDLTLEKETTFNGVPHCVVRFKWGSIPVRLFLKKESGAPSAVETVTRLPFPWSVWGDVPMTTRWSNWGVLDNGVMEPSQFSTEIAGYPVSDETILTAEATLGAGAVIASKPPTIPPDDGKGVLARYKPVQVVPGITQYQGPFNTFVVDQPDGLVVIEPVMNPAFGSAFLDQLAKDMPGKRVKAVVATDDAWPHFGGIRSFAARGAELVVLDVNRTIVQRFLDSTHLTLPDELAQHPAKARYKLVRKPTTIGSGPNRMVLYPIAGQGSERMLMAYFPEHKLLYGSDLLQKQGPGFFFPSYPKELFEAVEREKLPVETVFAEHLGPTPWKVVSDFVAKFR